jgi:hypothetical protein
MEGLEMRLLQWGTAGFVLAGMSAFGANAATTTYDVSFSANGFISTYGQPAPSDPVTGSFRITFDPTQTYTDATSGIVFKTLNIALGSALSFDYSPTGNTNGAADELVVGGLQDGAGTVQYSPSTDDFWLHINTFTTSPTFQQVGYSATSAGSQSLFYTPGTAGENGSASVTPVTTVPELSTWAMMLTGFAGLGWFGYARKRGIQAAAA